MGRRILRAAGATPEEFLTAIHSGGSSTFSRAIASHVQLRRQLPLLSTAMLLNLNVAYDWRRYIE
jgi:hypothetical protein